MRNEIFARHGYRFKTEDMRSHFAGESWYVPKYDDIGAVSKMLSSIEKQNVSLIQQFEKH